MRTIASVAHVLNARNQTAALPALLAMTDTLRCPDPSKLLPLFPKGSALIYRNGDHPDRFAIGLSLRLACQDAHIPFIWAGDAGGAIAIDADGLHLRDQPESRLREASLWRQHAPDRLLLAAAHSETSLQDAAAIHADAVLLSPVFPTQTHPGEPNLGLTQFIALCHACTIPVYALGGITDDNCADLLDTPCVGIAGIDWVLSLSSWA